MTGAKRLVEEAKDEGEEEEERSRRKRRGRGGVGGRKVRYQVT